MVSFSKESACAFTGRRPKGLPWGYEESGRQFNEFELLLYKTIKKAYENGYSSFLCGMALGTDLLFCENVLKLKDQKQSGDFPFSPDISLIAALPFQGQAKKWSQHQQKRYYNALNQCDDTYCASKTYTHSSCLARNRWMVDNASLLISAWDGDEKGGTWYTIKYALEHGLRVINVWID